MYNEQLENWAYQWDCCWKCKRRGAWKHGLEIHHLTRGRARYANDLATTCMACRECHDEEHRGSRAIGLIGWLYLKKQYDPNNYDLAKVLALRRRALTSITETDVDTLGASICTAILGKS